MSQPDPNNNLVISLTNTTDVTWKLHKDISQNCKYLQKPQSKSENISVPSQASATYVVTYKGGGSKEHHHQLVFEQHWLPLSPDAATHPLVVQIVFGLKTKQVKCSCKGKETYTMLNNTDWSKVPPNVQLTIAQTSGGEAFHSNEKRDSSDWSSDEEPKKGKFGFSIKEKSSTTSNQPNDETQAIEESRLAFEREKAIIEREEEELRLAMQMSLQSTSTATTTTTTTSQSLPPTGGPQHQQQEARGALSANTSSGGGGGGGAPVEPEAKIIARQYIEDAMKCFELGRFVESIPYIQQAIACLVKQPKGHLTFQHEIQYAAWYYQAIYFLIELQKLQSMGLFSQMGLVSKFLADLPIQNIQHRLTLVRIALKINFQLGNFETAGRLMHMMAAIPNLPETETLKKMFSKCEEEKFSEHSRPVIQSPILCYKTLRLILSDAYDTCDFCGASFRPNVLQACAFCNYSLKRQSISAFLQAQAAAQAAAAQQQQIAQSGQQPDTT